MSEQERLARAWHEGRKAGLKHAFQVQKWNKTAGRFVPDEYKNPYEPEEQDPALLAFTDPPEGK